MTLWDCTAPVPVSRVKNVSNAAHLRFVLDELGSMRAEVETGLSEALHQVAEKVAQRALVVIISDRFMDPETLRSCFQHLH